MTAVVDDPLIAGMAIRRVLPLHESSRRLRTLYPECPRVYGVAVMSDVSRRRWWPLAVGADQRAGSTPMFAAAAEEMDSPRRGRPAVGGHAGPRGHRPGRRAGRARGPGLGHRPGEPLGARRLRRRHRLARCRRPDAAGAARRSLRRRGARRKAWWNCPARPRWRPGSRTAATASLAPLFARLHAASGGAVSVASMWHTVGSAIVVAATQVPHAGRLERGRRHAPRPGGARRAGRIRVAGARPVQPARTGPESSSANRREGLAKLGQPCLC